MRRVSFASAALSCLIQILRLRFRQRLVRFEQLLLEPLDILLGVGVCLLHAVVRAEEAGANPIRLLLARMQIAPLGGCLGILQHLLQLLDLVLDVARLLRTIFLIARGSDRLQKAETAGQSFLFGPQILDALQCGIAVLHDVRRLTFHVSHFLAMAR